MRVAIIPARGGSKGVPRKNVRPVAGKPLLAWTVEAAVNAKTVDRVIVSTDDAEIGAVAERYGAEVVWRPAEISGDTASSESALLHVLQVLESRGEHPEEIVFLQATSPLTTAEDIDGCVNRLTETGADSAFTAKPFFYFIWKENADGSCDGINHDKRTRPRRQDREPQYEENGAVYVMKTDGFLKAKHRFFGKTVMSLMPEDRCFEIDTAFDLDVAGRLLSGRQEKVQDGKRPLPEIIGAVVFDFDGVMTDDTVWVSQTGEETVRCSRADGQGISRAKAWKIPLLILSSEVNEVVAVRARKLGLEVIHGVGLQKKADVLAAWAQNHGLPAERIVYMGNDLNDVACMRWAGFAAAPADACAEAKAVADWVAERPGGQGAVRALLNHMAQTLNLQF